MESINLTRSTNCNGSLHGATFVNETPSIPPVYLQGIAVPVYTLLSVMTVGGNALVCLIVFYYMGFMSVTNLFIANLALTDFFIGIFCIPIVLVSDFLLFDWPFGLFMCKFTSFAQSVFVVCTVFTLTAMSVDRYVAIIHPLQPKLTRKQCQYIIASLWIFAILFSMPIFWEMKIRRICFYREPNRINPTGQTFCESTGLNPLSQTVYNITTMTIIYLFPLCILSIVYIRLGWRLSQSQSPGEAHSERDAKIRKSKQKVIKMCFCVVIMFGVCWFPMQLYTNILRPYLDQILKKKYVPHIYFAFHLMAMSNSCVNPIIYGVMSSRFRAGYEHYLRYFLSCFGYFNKYWKTEENLHEPTLLTASCTTRRTTQYRTSQLQLQRLSTQHGNAASISPLLSCRRISSYT